MNLGLSTALLWAQFENYTDPRHLHRFLCISLITTKNFNGSNPDCFLALTNAYRAVCPGYTIFQIGSMNYHPLFRVRSWNSGIRCMSFYILLHHRMGSTGKAPYPWTWMLSETSRSLMYNRLQGVNSMLLVWMLLNNVKLTFQNWQCSKCSQITTIRTIPRTMNLNLAKLRPLTLVIRCHQHLLGQMSLG